MIRITKETKFSNDEILNLASEFFGKDGVGLEERDRNPCCIVFEGGGGHVSISTAKEGNKQTVDVESREWEYQARQFLEKL